MSLRLINLLLWTYKENNINSILQAHRVVLAASCAYFDAMFNVGLEETQKGNVALPSVPPDILPMIIDFIYTGNQL